MTDKQQPWGYRSRRPFDDDGNKRPSDRQVQYYNGLMEKLGAQLTEEQSAEVTKLFG